MSSPALLEFLAKAIRADSTRGPGSGGTRVVRATVVDPEVDPEAGEGVADLLAGIASYRGDARAVDAATAETAVASSDAELRGALLSATDMSARPGAALDLLVDASGVRVSGKETDVLSPGERELVGLVAALLDPGWETTSLGLITYSEERMDQWLRRAAWGAVSLALVGKQIGHLQTLLILARSGRIDTRVHCADELGADWVVDGDRLVRRGPIESARQHAAEVVGSSLNPTVLYLGAGFSFSSALPGGDELRDRALRDYYAAQPDAAIEPLARRLFQHAQEAQKLTELQVREGEDFFVGSLTLEDVIALVKELSADPPPVLDFFAEKHAAAIPGPAVEQLAALLTQVAGLVIVTVNFDELVERASPDGSLHPVVDADTFRAFPSYLQRYLAGEEVSVPLVKLHGTISDRASCVVSAVQTRQGLIDYKAAALRALTADRSSADRPHWIYIGTSLRDRDIVPVLREPAFASSFEESWVMPLRGRGVDALCDSRALQWQEGRRPLDARTFSVSADAFTGFMVAAASP